MPKFSIITSSHVWHELKKKQLERCYKSIESQMFDDWEWVLVDDGSPSNNIFPSFKDKRVNVVKQVHLERYCSLDRGLKESSGEWIVFLDSDDEFFSHSLLCMNQMIDANPKAKMFNYGSLHINTNYITQIRGCFKPGRNKIGHEVFGGGTIVNGTFLFHKSVYKKQGGFPNFHNPWDFSIHAQKEFPEIKPYFTATPPDHPKGYPKELGNPFGNDYYLFYKYTRKFHSIPYDIPLLIVHNEGKKADDGHRLKTN